MTSIDIPHITDDPSKALRAFTGSCADIIKGHIGNLDPAQVMAMSEDTQQALVDKINPYLAFEYAQTPEIHHLPVAITGYGLLFIADESGEILGAETVSDGDVITGTLSEAWVCPVPTIESVQHSNAVETPILGQTLAGVLLLSNGIYKTGLNGNSEFEVEHDLGMFQLGIPLSHLFDIRYVSD